MKGILGRKLGMTQLILDNGEVVPVTIIQAGPCYVTQVRKPGVDGYAAVQLGFQEVPEWKLTRPALIRLRKNGLPPLKVLREFRLSDSESDSFEIGQQITVDIFKEGERVDVSGTSKGRGFQGGVRRHGFSGGPKTHGQSDRWRAPGSIGSGTTPGRVYKGTRMAGHMGSARVTVQNLQVVKVDAEKGVLAVKGAVPGSRNGLLIIRGARKQG